MTKTKKLTPPVKEAPAEVATEVPKEAQGSAPKQVPAVAIRPELRTALLEYLKVQPHDLVDALVIELRRSPEITVTLS